MKRKNTDTETKALKKQEISWEFKGDPDVYSREPEVGWARAKSILFQLVDKVSEFFVDFDGIQVATSARLRETVGPLEKGTILPRVSLNPNSSRLHLWAIPRAEDVANTEFIANLIEDPIGTPRPFSLFSAEVSLCFDRVFREDSQGVSVPSFQDKRFRIEGGIDLSDRHADLKPLETQLLESDRLLHRFGGLEKGDAFSPWGLHLSELSTRGAKGVPSLVGFHYDKLFYAPLVLRLKMPMMSMVAPEDTLLGMLHNGRY